MTERTIYIFFGLIASGKSTLADMFAAAHRYPYYNTDRVRKELAGLAANERSPEELGQGIYSPEFTERTYKEMLERAAQDLHQGAESVVLDGSYSRLDDRKKVLALTENLDVRVLFILCACSDQEVKRRLDLRAKDPEAVSDGSWGIYVKQKDSFQFPDELSEDQFIQLDTEADPEQLLHKLKHSIENRT